MMIAIGGSKSRVRGLSGFRKVGSVKQFRDGVGRTVTVDGHDIAVFKRGSRFYAMGDKCPHMGASLSMGRLVGDRVQCSWHEWTFDLETGRNRYKSWACVPIYEVRVEGDDVLVEVPKPEEPPAADPEGDDDGWFKWDPDTGKSEP
jgi:nitrite reductase/ring-hydroxylating ferredoxin subunit